MTITLPANLHRRQRTLRTAAAFGLSIDAVHTLHADRLTRLASAAAELLASLPPGGIALVTGPSGSGKSTLLKTLVPPTGGGALSLRRSVHFVETTRLHRENRPVAQLSRLSLSHWLKLLAAFGLAEAPLLLTPAQHLSAGQHYRLALALAFQSWGAGFQPARKAVPSLILADEFCSLLDRPTALSIAASIRRFLGTPAVSAGSFRPIFIAATAHDDLTQALQPDAILSLDDHAITLATR